MNGKSEKTPFEKFKELASNLMSVPKEEVAKEEEKWKKNKGKKSKPNLKNN